MKVLLITTAIEGGGAANAALRLYLALRSEGLAVRLLVLRRPKVLAEDLANDCNITFLEDKWANKIKSRLAFVMERIDILFRNGFNKEKLWQYSTAHYGLDLAQHEWVQWADILHLQWINHGTLRLASVKRLQALNKKIVWTLHDLFPLTGLAHLPCLDRETTPLFSRKFAKQKSLTLSSNRKATIEVRNDFIEQKEIHYIAVSSFVKDLAEQVLENKEHSPIEVITPPLDLAAYQREEIDKNSFAWYQEDEYYLLISAARLDDPIKGANLLIRLGQELQRLYPEISKRINILLLGHIKNVDTYKNLGVKQIKLGHIAEAKRLRQLYQLADLTLSTSLFETFGLTLVESLAMGTSVISFDCGGPKDIIRNGVNGYLIEDFDYKVMAHLIFRLLEDNLTQHITANQCRASVEQLDSPAIAQQHIDYYYTLLNKNE